MLKLGQEVPPWPQQSKEQREGCQRPSQGRPNQHKGPSEATAWSFGLFPNVEMAAFSRLWSSDSCPCTTSASKAWLWKPMEIACVDQYIYQHKEKEGSMVSSSNTISDPVAMTLIIIATSNDDQNHCQDFCTCCNVKCEENVESCT